MDDTHNNEQACIEVIFAPPGVMFEGVAKINEHNGVVCGFFASQNSGKPKTCNVEDIRTPR